MTDAMSAAWEEEVLKPDGKVFFQPMHAKYGRAEFEFCHVFKRGKLQTVFVYPMQQEVASIYYKIDCHGRADFAISSLTYKGIDEPKIWYQYWCRAHKGIALRVYVPLRANHFRVGYGDVRFDFEAPHVRNEANA